MASPDCLTHLIDRHFQENRCQRGAWLNGCPPAAWTPSTTAQSRPPSDARVPTACRNTPGSEGCASGTAGQKRQLDLECEYWRLLQTGSGRSRRASWSGSSGKLATGGGRGTAGCSDYRNHVALARPLHDYLRWRNYHARHPDVLGAQRRERTQIRSERSPPMGSPGTTNRSVMTRLSSIDPANVRSGH